MNKSRYNESIYIHVNRKKVSKQKPQRITNLKVSKHLSIKSIETFSFPHRKFPCRYQFINKFTLATQMFHAFISGAIQSADTIRCLLKAFSVNENERMTT